MFLKCNHRSQDGKEYRYWSLVESRRCAHGRVVQRPVLYLGESNDRPREAWIRCIEVFDAEARQQVKRAWFPADRPLPAGVPDGVPVQREPFSLHRARQWGACWLFVQLWKQPHLDQFGSERLAPCREGADWHAALQTLVAYRWSEPGSEWRLHRHCYLRQPIGYSSVAGRGWKPLHDCGVVECVIAGAGRRRFGERLRQRRERRASPRSC